MERWVDFIERRYRVILALSALVAILSAASLLRLRLDLDILDMLPRGAPAFDNFRSFVSEFGELDELIILLEGDNPAELQSFADDLGAQLSQLPEIEHVQVRIDREQVFDGILGRYLFNYLPVSAHPEVERRFTPQGMSEQIERARAILKAPFDLQGARLVRRDPLGLIPLAARHLEGATDTGSYGSSGYISSSDGNALLVMARPRAGAFDIQFSKALMADVQRVTEEARARHAAASVRVGFTGSYAYAIEDEATIRADIRRYVGLSLVIVLAIFVIGYRSLRILPFITWPLVLSTLISFAASVVWYSSLNAVSTSFAAILYGLSIDSGIHYYTRLLQERSRYPLKRAVFETLVRLRGANVVASATTAAVFAIIGASGLRGISQLGQLTGFGMMVNIAQFFLIYPALSFAMGPRTAPVGSADTNRLAALAGWCRQHSRVVLGITAIIALVWISIGAQVGLDSDLTRLRPRGSRAAAIHDRIADTFGSGSGAGAVLVHGPGLESALQTSERVESQLRRYHEEGLITSVRAVSALLPSEKMQRERLAAFEQMPRPVLAEQLRLALSEGGFATAAFEPFLQRLVSPVELIRFGDPALQPFSAVLARMIRPTATGFTVGTFFDPAPGVSLGSMESRLRRDLADRDFVVTGRGLLEEALAAMLRREAMWFFVGAFALNLLIVWLQFRSLSFSLILLTPPALIVLACLTLMHTVGNGIGPVNVIVIPLILGIGVDNCVYLAERYREDGSIENAARLGGRALCISALTTMAGFGFLGLSKYPALSDLGWLSAVCLFLCLIASLTVLPALLAAFRPAGRGTP